MQQPLLPPEGLQVAAGRLWQPALSLEGLRADGKPVQTHPAEGGDPACCTTHDLHIAWDQQPCPLPAASKGQRKVTETPACGGSWCIQVLFTHQHNSGSDASGLQKLPISWRMHAKH